VDWAILALGALASASNGERQEAGGEETEIERGETHAPSLALKGHPRAPLNPRPPRIILSLSGAVMPAFSVLLGRVMDAIGDPTTAITLDTAALWFLYLGAVAGAAAYAEAAAWGCAGVRAGRAARVRFLEAALAKPMAFHEGVSDGPPQPATAGDKAAGKGGAVVAVSASAATTSTAPAPPPSFAAPSTVSVRLMRALEDDAETVRRTLAVDCGPFVSQVAKVVAGLAVGERREKREKRERKERGREERRDERARASSNSLSPLPLPLSLQPSGGAGMSPLSSWPSPLSLPVSCCDG
jgi:hypothetical protein